MKIGDLVRLSRQKTRRGFSYESMTGLIIDIRKDEILKVNLYEVNFGGSLYTFTKKEIEKVNL